MNKFEAIYNIQYTMHKLMIIKIKVKLATVTTRLKILFYFLEQTDFLSSRTCSVFIEEIFYNEFLRETSLTIPNKK